MPDGRSGLCRLWAVINIRLRSAAGKIGCKALAEGFVLRLCDVETDRLVLLRLLLGIRQNGQRGGDNGRDDQRIRKLVALHVIGERLLQLLRRLKTGFGAGRAGFQNDG